MEADMFKTIGLLGVICVMMSLIFVQIYSLIVQRDYLGEWAEKLFGEEE